MTTDDQIKKLLQGSKIETSDRFVEETIDKLDARIIQRMKIRLYCLMIGILLFLILVSYMLIDAGFSLHFLSINIELPKYFTIVVTTVFCYTLVYYIKILIPAESLE